MQQVVKAFQLGNSTVITLPKELGIVPGQRLEVKKMRGNIVLKAKKLREEEVRKLVDSLAGGLNLKKHLTPEEINKVLDEEYEDHKIVLPRR